MTDYPWTTCGFRTVDGKLEYFSERSDMSDRQLDLSQDSAIRLQHTVDSLRDTIREQEAVILREITAVQIQRLQDALEGFCEGLAIEENTARAILHYVFTGLIEDEDECQNYNCHCAHPSQCDNSCFRNAEGE